METWKICIMRENRILDMGAAEGQRDRVSLSEP